MKVLQLYYTSCEKGMGAGKGFQTFSMSNGITAEEQLELERMVCYIPPNHLPLEPTEKEIREQFPTAFSFLQLTSGRYAISQSNYVGQDYSGRFGNFFGHALVLEQGMWPFYPISLCGSSVFKRRLSRAEKNITNTPSPLPILTLKDLPLNSQLEFAAVSQWVSEDRLTLLQQMVSACLERTKTGRRLAICDTPETQSLWAASLQMSLPIQLAHHLTVSTYTFDMHTNNALVCGVVSDGTRYSYSALEHEGQFFVFDQILGQKSETPSMASMVEILDVGWTLERESLQRFHDFLDQFKFDSLDQNVELVYTLYNFLITQKNDWNIIEMVDVIDFANRHAPAVIVIKLGEKIFQTIDDFQKIDREENAQAIIQLLFRTFNLSGDRSHQEAAFQFLTQLQESVSFGAALTSEQGLVLFRSLPELGLSHIDQWAKQAISNPQLERLHKRLTALTESDGKIIEVLVELMLHNLALSGQSFRAMLSRPAFIRLIIAALERHDQIQELLCPAMETQGLGAVEFAKLFTPFLEAGGGSIRVESAMLTCFQSHIDQQQSMNHFQVRKTLAAMGYERFMFLEFQNRLLVTEPMALFHEWNKNLFLKEKKSFKNIYDRIIKLYLAKVPKQHVIMENVAILQDISLIQDQKLIAMLVSQVENALPLSAEAKKHDQIIATLLAVKESMPSLAITSHVTELLAEAIRLEQRLTAEPVNTRQIIAQLEFEWGDISAEQFSQYLNWIMPLLLSLPHSPESFARVFKPFAELNDETLRQIFATLFTKHLRKRLKGTASLQKPKDPTFFSHFMIYYLDTLLGPAAGPTAKALQIMLWQPVVNLIGDLPESFIEHAELALKKRLPVSRTGLTLLEQLKNNLAKKKANSLMGRVKSLFGKVTNPKKSEE